MIIGTILFLIVQSVDNIELQSHMHLKMLRLIRTTFLLSIDIIKKHGY